MSISTACVIVVVQTSMALYSTSQFLLASSPAASRSGDSSRTQKGVRLDSGRSPWMCCGFSATKPYVAALACSGCPSKTIKKAGWRNIGRSFMCCAKSRAMLTVIEEIARSVSTSRTSLSGIALPKACESCSLRFSPKSATARSTTCSLRSPMCAELGPVEGWMGRMLGMPLPRTKIFGSLAKKIRAKSRRPSAKGGSAL
mmetsp:Transcript_90510/g.230220  ORF Transcript_90510/g.230220 Transcript_90510/m.230220 type:complete len:200 (+) Transcript_90510:159-758(+)